MTCGGGSRVRDRSCQLQNDDDNDDDDDDENGNSIRTSALINPLKSHSRLKQSVRVASNKKDRYSTSRRKTSKTKSRSKSKSKSRSRTRSKSKSKSRSRSRSKSRSKTRSRSKNRERSRSRSRSRSARRRYGRRRRWRREADQQVLFCPGDDKEAEECNRDKCPELGPWSEWSGCSKTCGGGERLRSRQCGHFDNEEEGSDAIARAIIAIFTGQRNQDDNPCKDTLAEKEACNEEPCPGMYTVAEQTVDFLKIILNFFLFNAINFLF